MTTFLTRIQFIHFPYKDILLCITIITLEANKVSLIIQITLNLIYIKIKHRFKPPHNTFFNVLLFRYFDLDQTNNYNL